MISHCDVLKLPFYSPIQKDYLSQEREEFCKDDLYSFKIKDTR